MTKLLTFPFPFLTVLLCFLLFSLWGQSFLFSFQVVLLCFLFFFSGVHTATFFLEPVLAGRYPFGRDRKALPFGERGVAVFFMPCNLVGYIATPFPFRSVDVFLEGRRMVSPHVFTACSGALFPASTSVGDPLALASVGEYDHQGYISAFVLAIRHHSYEYN